MKIKQIVFLFEIPFKPRHYKSFGIDNLKRNGFDVEIWDMSGYYHSCFTGKEYPHLSHKIISKKDIEDKLASLDKSTLVFSTISFSYRTYFIYKVLSGKNIDYAFFVCNTLPITSSSLSEKILKLPNTPLNTILSFLINNALNKFLNISGIRPSSFYVAGGSDSLKYINHPAGKTTNIVWAHSFDYDTFLLEMGNVSSDGGILLDEFISYHTDFKLLKIEPPLKPEEYYPKICKFFDEIEKISGEKITIAAHPDSTYDILPDCFDNRPIIKDNTFNLVQNCKFVIANASTSINFAVICNKPIIFYTTNSLKNSKVSPLGQIADTMATLLNRQIHNLDDPITINFDSEMEIDKEAYKNYKEKYIKTKGSPEKESSLIISDYIHEVYV
jgi:hypothetical protein